MKTQLLKSLSFTLLLACCLSCGEKCSICTKEQGCTECYLSLVQNRGTCGPVPAYLANCLLTDRANRCQLCDKTTALQAVTGKCVPIRQPITNCVSNVLLRSKSLCVACENGTYPNPDNTRCVNYDIFKYPNCDWASRKLYTKASDGPKCLKCSGELSGNEDEVCGNFYGARGCLGISPPDSQGIRTCLACNVFNGYYMKAPGDLKSATPYQARQGEEEELGSGDRSQEKGLGSLGRSGGLQEMMESILSELRNRV